MLFTGPNKAGRMSVDVITKAEYRRYRDRDGSEIPCPVVAGVILLSVLDLPISSIVYCNNY